MIESAILEKRSFKKLLKQYPLQNIGIKCVSDKRNSFEQICTFFNFKEDAKEYISIFTYVNFSMRKYLKSLRTWIKRVERDVEGKK